MSVGVGALLLLGYLVGPRFPNDAATGALYLATVGLGISLFLVGILVLGFAPLCPMCFVVHTSNVLLWPVLFAIVGRSPRAIVGSGIAALRFVVGLKPKDEPNPDLPWTASGFFAAALVAL